MNTIDTLSISARLLYLIIKKHDGRNGFPCMLSADELSILLARKLRKEGCSIKLIEKNMSILRKKGWVQTYILQWKSRDLLIPTNQFAKEQKTINCVRCGEMENLPVIRHQLISLSENSWRLKPRNDLLIPTKCRDYYTNNSIIDKNELLFIYWEKEKGAIERMIGFHDYFNKKNPPQNEVDIEDARKLFDLVKGRITQKRTSLSGWAKDIAKLRRKHPDFPDVFDWLLSNIATCKYLNSINSPSGFGKRYIQIKKWCKDGMGSKPKTTLPDGYFDNTDYVTEQSEIIRKEFPKECNIIDEIGEHELGLGIYNMKHWASVTMEHPLDRLVDGYGKNSDMWNIAVKLRRDVEDEDMFLEGVRGVIKRLSNWKDWEGHFRKRLIFGITTIDNKLVLNKPATDWFIWLMKKRGEHETRRHRQILNAINEELNSED